MRSKPSTARWKMTTKRNGATRSPGITAASSRAAITGMPASTCREYEHTVYINDRPQTMVGKACRQRDGTWKSIS